MWIYERDLNRTLLVELESVKGVVLKISECYRLDDKILFERSGAYYIYEENNPNTKPLVFSNYINGRFYSEYIIISGSELLLIKNNTKFPKKFVVLDTTRCQEGYYKYNHSTDKWDAQIESHSDPVDSVDNNYEFQQLYKSTTLLGSYQWQGEGSENDIKVGWKKYKHKAIDSEGNQTNEYINVVESVGLTESSYNQWRYTYQGVEYSYAGEISNEDFTMTNEEEEISMEYVAYISLSKPVFNFDGGAQVVD